MLINNGDGTFTMGPADVLCIFKLPSDRYHVVVLEEAPMPGPIKSVSELDFVRLKSTGHHTEGAGTLEGAQLHIAAFRQKIKVDDANVLADVALEIEDPVCVLMASNWTKGNISLRVALGLQVAT